MKSVFAKPRFHDGLVWTAGLTIEIKFRFQIPPVYCERGLIRQAMTTRLRARACFPANQAYRGILADVIVYIFAHLHRALRTEANMLDIN